MFANLKSFPPVNVLRAESIEIERNVQSALIVWQRAVTHVEFPHDSVHIPHTITNRARSAGLCYFIHCYLMDQKLSFFDVDAATDYFARLLSVNFPGGGIYPFDEEVKRDLKSIITPFSRAAAAYQCHLNPNRREFVVRFIDGEYTNNFSERKGE